MRSRIKKNKITIISVFLVFLLCGISYAKGELLTYGSFDPEKFKISNPFEAQFQEITSVENKLKEKKPKMIKNPEQAKKTKEEDKPLSPPKITITGLIWNSEKPQAIANGQIVNIGDYIEECEILDINKDGLEIQFMTNSIQIPAN
ncbi:MAG: hypothetical protein HQL27_02225 [Candidatus Omnitrophica bacterium]|nr:hypothetical protein [Candidatus Omnitrophota bacterium]